MIFNFGPFAVDTDRLELTQSGEPIAVQPQVFSLLVYLLSNNDRVVSKDELINEVWQGRIVGDGTLNARINALRRALGDDGVSQSMIKTLPRQGFRFVGDLSGPTSKVEPAKAKTGAAAPIIAASLAVLPFVNISADKEQEYFADGLTEDLITDLSKNSGLFVIARNSSFSFRGSPKTVTEIGSELGVAHVLEGSVRRAGDRVRINAQLIDTETGGHVWAERYDGNVQDIFDLQDEITAKIATALEANLTGASKARRGTLSVEAYELSLKGRSKFYMFSPETNQECIDLQERAIAIDPNFSNAWAELVFPHQSGWSFAWKGYDDGLNVALEKAIRAADLDPDSALAHCRLGWVNTFLRKPDTALKHFEIAVELEPNNADTHTWYCESLNYAGQPDLGVEIGLRAIEFDPVVPPNVLHHIGHAHFLMGDLESAAEYDARAIRMAPSFPPARIVMSAIEFERGRIDAAKEQISDLLAIDPSYNFRRYDERYPYYNDVHRQRMRDALIGAGLPNEF